MTRSAGLLGSPVNSPGQREPSAPDVRRPDLDRLARLCHALDDILRSQPEPGPGLVNLREELASFLQAGAQQLAARLRGELPCWTTALEHLRQLSECRYLPLPENLAALRDELARVERQAQQVAAALEALGEGDSPPHPDRLESDPSSTGLPRQLLGGEEQEPGLERLLEVGRLWLPPQPPEEEAGCPQNGAGPPADRDPGRETRRATAADTPTQTVGALPTQCTPPADLSAGSRPAPAAGTPGSLEPDHPPQARARLREVRKAPKEQTAARQEHTREKPPPGPTAAPVRDSGVVRVDCPTCGVQGAIRPDRLGRLHVCRRCEKSYRVDPSGGLVEVIRTKDNKWVDREPHAARSRRDRVRRFVTRGLLPLLGLVAVVLLGWWLSSRRAAPARVGLPRGLQPRAELFTKAWLKKDWAQMRLLVTPGEDRNLYKWSVLHPLPATSSQGGKGSQDGQIEVTALSTQAQKATVKVRIRGAGGAAGRPLEFTELWGERGDTWFFVVPADRPERR